jgi:hypothetical protein
MSSYIWNTVGERTHLSQAIMLAYVLLVEEDDALSSDSSSGSSSNSNNSINTLYDIVIPHTIAFANYIFTPLIDHSIDFDIPDKIISDFNEYQCVMCFRFQKQDLQTIADTLWGHLQNYVVGNKQNITCGNYCAAYETGICVVLYRFHFPTVFRSEMEQFFQIQKS